MVNPVYQQDEELLLNPFGSRYLASGEYTDVNSNEFVVQEDTVISVLTGGDVSISENSIDYKASMNLSGVTLKRGALIVAPVGEAFKSITIDSGSIMAYNCVVGGTKPSGSVPLLLDDYPDAVAAYSLRKLRTDYEGPAIKVRVDIPGTDPYDIGFDSNGELDVADLLSKAAGNDAYVLTWYDQSGGAGNDATQSVASNQPKIVSSGSVVTLNSKPNITSSSGSFLNLPLATVNRYYAFSTSSLSNTEGIDISNSVNSYFTLIAESGSTNTTVNNANAIFNSFFINGVPESFTTRGNLYTLLSPQHLKYTDISFILGGGTMRLGHFNAVTFPMYDLQEYIFYTTNQSSNRAAIESNINSHYNIY